MTPLEGPPGVWLLPPWEVLDGHLAAIQRAMEREMEKTTLADVMNEARAQVDAM